MESYGGSTHLSDDGYTVWTISPDSYYEENGLNIFVSMFALLNKEDEITLDLPVEE